MLVVIPVFREEVSPRFGFTSEVLLARVEGGQVELARRVSLGGRGGRQLLSFLAAEKPQVVICGGIHPSWQVLLEREGMKVIWGVIGPAEDALKSYVAGTLRSNQFVCRGRRGARGRGGFRRGNRRK